MKKNYSFKKSHYWFVILILGVGVYFLYLLINTNPLVVPEAGYCIEKNLDTEYTTVRTLNGTKTSLEYCPLESFCEESITDTVFSDEEFNTTLIGSFIEEQTIKGLECFTDLAIHTKRDDQFLFGQDQSLKTLFACCTADNLESPGCPGNTCEGRYMGFLDSEGCRVYAIEQGFNEEGIMKITTCGGNVYNLYTN